MLEKPKGRHPRLKGCTVTIVVTDGNQQKFMARRVAADCGDVISAVWKTLKELNDGR